MKTGMILMALSKTTFGQINYALMPNGGRPNTNGDENTQFQYALDVENINQKNGGSYAPPVTPTANTCWSCKAAESYDDCLQKGNFEVCDHIGQEPVCGLEIRRYLSSTRIYTGCAPKKGCEALRNQNFVGPYKWRTQCRIETPALWSRRFGESVCRQCFSTCDAVNNPGACFSLQSDVGVPLLTLPTETYWDPLSATDRTTWSQDIVELQAANNQG